MLPIYCQAMKPVDWSGEISKLFQPQFEAVSSDADLFQAIVDLPFKQKALVTPLGLGLMVLVLVNKKTSTVDRTALSDTEMARGAVEYSVLPFRAINIPLQAKDNILVKA